MKTSILWNNITLWSNSFKYTGNILHKKIKTIYHLLSAIPDKKNACILCIYNDNSEKIAQLLSLAYDDFCILLCHSAMNPSRFYPQCNYILHTDGDPTLEKLNHQLPLQELSLLIPNTEEQVSYLPLTPIQIERYQNILKEHLPKMQQILIYSDLFTFDLAIHILAAIELKKEIIFFDTKEDLKEIISPSASQIIVMNETLLAQCISSKDADLYLSSTSIICNPQSPIQLIDLIHKSNLSSDNLFLFNGMPKHPKSIALTKASSQFSSQTSTSLILNGEYVSASFIEENILKYPPVEKALVTIQLNKDYKPKLICFYLIAETDFEEWEIQEFLENSIPTFMIPSTFKRLTEFPINSQYQIDRSQLPLIYENNYTNELYVNNDVEKKIVAFIEQYTNTPFLQEDFEKPIELLGINSLLFIDFIVSLEDELDFQMPDTMLDIELFKNVKHLMSYISTLKAEVDNDNHHQ